MVSTLPRASAVIQIESSRSGQSIGNLGKALFVGTAKEKPELTLRGVLVYDQVSGSEGGERYELYGDLPSSLSSDPKCIEYVTFELQQNVTFEDFFGIWSSGLKAVEKCEGCQPVVLGRSTSNPWAIVQIQPWQTYEDHIPNFRVRPDIEEIMAPLANAVDRLVEGGWAGMTAYHLLL